MDWQLKRLEGFTPRPGPLLVVVMDGVGLGRGDEGDAVALARTPVLDWLRANCPNVRLKAHGTAVGLPSDEDMGNSEVGHNALGAGRVFDQGAKLVNRAIADGSIFAGAVWKKLIAQCVTHDSALHLIGLLSDGNVHSHQDHLHALISRAAADGIKTLFVHPLLDGRDVPESSALIYIDRLEAHLAQFDGREGRRYRIASGGGRMVTTMDRYGADWRIVERGWNAHVHGEGRAFASARAAIETYRAEQPDLIDQFMPPFVIVAKDAAAGPDRRNAPPPTPIGPICDGDSVIFFNFRGDRALEISQAFERDAFPHFDRGRRPAVEYAGMMQYDGDEHVPAQFLVTPPLIERTLGEYLARNRVRQFACSETQKFGHVTYFWNGNRTGMFDAQFEEYLEIPSDRVPFQERPWMKSAEITDATIARLRAPRDPGSASRRDTPGTPLAGATGPAPAGATGIRGFDFGRINYANGDMVGHTGDRRAAILAVEAVDLALGRLLEVVREVGGIALVTADHGNSDEMYEREKSGAIAIDPQTGRPRPRTSHSLNAVPLILYDPIGLAAGSRALTLTPAGIGRNLAPRPPAIGVGADDAVTHAAAAGTSATGAPIAGASVTHATASDAAHASAPVAPLGLELPEGGAGLAHVAATCLALLGYAAPADYAPSLSGKGM